MKVEPMIDKEKMVHVPTVYDAAFKAGLSKPRVGVTGSSIWVWRD